MCTSYCWPAVRTGGGAYYYGMNPNVPVDIILLAYVLPAVYLL
jgi:hypothetical protein